MIVVTVDMVSANGPSRDRRLGRMTITNDGTGGRTRGNYDVRTSTGRRGRVTGYPREAVAIWNLIRRACEEAGYTK